MKQLARTTRIVLLLLLALCAAPESALAAKKKTDVYKGTSYSRVYNYTYYTTQTKYGKRYAGKPDLAIAHFVRFGMKRGQQASASFDVKSYFYGCPSLRREFGDDYASYYLHYQKTGYKKAYYRKRATGIAEMQEPLTKYGKVDLRAIYDYHYYIRRYPSVLRQTGEDDRAVLKHFVTVGMKKKRAGRDTELYPKAKPSSATWRKLEKKIRSTHSFDGTGITVCIDPGHQLRGMYSHEPVGPGSSQTKPKVTSGAYGHYSHKNEYEINLEVGLKLRDELKARGYTVVMTRTTHNVQITNIARAQIANKAKADILVRIHADDIEGASSLAGVHCYAAASNNPYLSRSAIAGGQRLAVLLRDAQAAATGQNRAPNLYANDMTGINWAKMPSVIVEMGYMSNPTEDLRMANSGFQLKIAYGLANGIDRYFSEYA